MTVDEAAPYIVNIITGYPFERHPLSGKLQFKNEDMGFWENMKEKKQETKEILDLILFWWMNKCFVILCEYVLVFDSDSIWDKHENKWNIYVHPTNSNFNLFLNCIFFFFLLFLWIIKTLVIFNDIWMVLSKWIGMKSISSFKPDLF